MSISNEEIIHKANILQNNYIRYKVDESIIKSVKRLDKESTDNKDNKEE